MIPPGSLGESLDESVGRPPREFAAYSRYIGLERAGESFHVSAAPDERRHFLEQEWWTTEQARPDTELAGEFAHEIGRGSIFTVADEIGPSGGLWRGDGLENRGDQTADIKQASSIPDRRERRAHLA